MSYYDVAINEIPVGWAGEPDDGEFYPVWVKELTLAEWQAIYQSDGSSDHWCRLSVRDNGEHGDGIQMEIKAGNTSVFRTLIPDESLDTLIEALSAIRRLRATESPSDA